MRGGSNGASPFCIFDKMDLDNMSDERREAMIALSMLTVGNARSCFTEDVILRVE